MLLVKVAILGLPPLTGKTVQRPARVVHISAEEDLEQALATALAARGPELVEVMTEAELV